MFGDKKYLRIEIFTDDSGPNKQDYAILGGEELKLGKIKLGESFYSSPVKVFESKDGKPGGKLIEFKSTRPSVWLWTKTSRPGSSIAQNARL